jgi:hypothetical protein
VKPFNPFGLPPAAPMAAEVNVGLPDTVTMLLLPR